MTDDFLYKLVAARSDEERDWLVMQVSLDSLAPEVRDSVWAAAIPHWFDEKFLAALLDKPESEVLPIFERLLALSFVEPFQYRGYNIHERSRALLLKQLWQSDQPRYRQFAQRAANYCSTQHQSGADWRIEHIYHLLIADPDRGINEFIDTCRDWRESPNFAHAKVEAMVLAARELADADRLSTRELAWTRFWEALLDYDHSQYQPAMGKLLHIKITPVEDVSLAAIVSQRLGDLLSFSGKHDEARRQYKAAMPLYEQIGARPGGTNRIQELGNIHLASSKYAVGAPMLVDVVFLKQGSPDLLHSNGFQFAWREWGGQVQTEKWERAARELAHLASRDNFTPVDVFLCLKTQWFAELLDRDFISRLLEWACNYSLGASVYVATDASHEPLHNLIDVMEHQYSLSNWNREIYKSGATDIIQAKFNTQGSAEAWNDISSVTSLFNSAKRSRARQRALSLEGNWKGLLRKEAGALKSLLNGFDIYTDRDVSPLRGGNWVVVMEEISSSRKRKIIMDKALALRPDKCLVAVGDSMRMSLSDDIENLERNGDWKIAWYRGSFELLYFFHLLSTDRSPSAMRPIGRVETIGGIAPPVFQQSQVAKAPSMLVTGSFPPPNAPPDQWHNLQAAIEVGQSVIRKPAHTIYIVSPSTDCAKLPATLEKSPRDLTVWLHVGQGHKEFGLQESSGEFQSAQRWLDCFLGHGNRGGSLSLAIFSACQTEEIALIFAQAGVGVAIGFEKPVPGDACRLLTSPIINAALRSGGDREAILQAYHNGCADLQSHGYGDLGPVAFRSERQE